MTTPDERTFALHDAVRAGQEADELQKNPAFRRAFAAVRDKIVQQMAEAPLTDFALHTSLISALQQLAMVKGALDAEIRSGDYAKNELARAATPRPQRRDFPRV